MLWQLRSPWWGQGVKEQENQGTFCKGPTLMTLVGVSCDFLKEKGNGGSPCVYSFTEYFPANISAECSSLDRKRPFFKTVGLDKVIEKEKKKSPIGKSRKLISSTSDNGLFQQAVFMIILDFIKICDWSTSPSKNWSNHHSTHCTILQYLYGVSIQ